MSVDTTYHVVLSGQGWNLTIDIIWRSALFSRGIPQVYRVVCFVRSSCYYFFTRK